MFCQKEEIPQTKHLPDLRDLSILHYIKECLSILAARCAGEVCHTLNKSRHNLHVRILFILQYPQLLLYQLLLLCQHPLRPQYQLHLQYPLLLHPLCCHRKELQRHHISH